MLFPRPILEGLADGSVTLAFRRWARPRVRVGTRLRTAAGVLEVVAVDPIAPDAIDEADALRAGARDRATLLAGLAGREGTLYRVELRHAGPDPRVALRDRPPDAAELAGLRGHLARMDAAARRPPWTAALLGLIAERPGTRAADLAAASGRERLALKRDVRRLKELGLTESLGTGYRLSPRGEAVRAALGEMPGA